MSFGFFPNGTLFSISPDADTGYYGTAAEEDLRGIKQDHTRKKDSLHSRRESLEEKVRELTDGVVVDMTFLAFGDEPTIIQACAITRRAGVIPRKKTIEGAAMILNMKEYLVLA